MVCGGVQTVGGRSEVMVEVLPSPVGLGGDGVGVAETVGEVKFGWGDGRLKPDENHVN